MTINTTQQPGLPTVLNKEQADIQGKAQAFLMSGDQIGFIGKLASEAPTEIAPVVNAARRMAKEAQAAQQPQGESITTAGMREVEQAKRGLSAAYELSQSQQQQDPRQAAIAGLPMQRQMFAGKRAGGIVAFANGGQPKFYPGMEGIQRGRDEIEERKRRLLEAEAEANKRGETIFTPRKNPGFIDFLGGESPITTPSLPPGQAYYLGIPGLMRGQEAAKKSLDSMQEPGSVLSQAEIEELSPALKSAIAPETKGTVSTDTDYLALSDAKLRKYYADLTGNPNLTIEQAKAFERSQKEGGAEDREGLELKFKDLQQKQQIEAADAKKIETDTTDKTKEDAPFTFKGKSADEIMKEATAKADELFPTIKGTNEFADPKKSVEEMTKFFEEAGVDLTNAEQKAAIQKEEALLAKDKKQGALYALMEFGFGMMAGKSPNFFTNVGEAGKAVAPRLFQLQKDIRAGNQRLTDSKLKLSELENAQKRGIATATLTRIEKQKDRVEQEKNRQATLRASYLKSFSSNKTAIQTAILSSETRVETTKMTTKAQKDIAKMKNASIDQQIVRLEERAYDEENPPSPQEKKVLLERIKFLNASRKTDPMAGFGGLLNNQPTVDVSRLENQPGMNRITP